MTFELSCGWLTRPCGNALKTRVFRNSPAAPGYITAALCVATAPFPGAVGGPRLRLAVRSSGRGRHDRGLLDWLAGSRSARRLAAAHLGQATLADALRGYRREVGHRFAHGGPGRDRCADGDLGPSNRKRPPRVAPVAPEARPTRALAPLTAAMRHPHLAASANWPRSVFWKRASFPLVFSSRIMAE